MRFKTILFHLKWLFKKRYIINIGVDFGMKDRPIATVIKYDRKYERFKVIQ